MTDKELYRLCKKYGARVLEARRKFAGLLPEVVRRRLFEKRGFCSIYEFAAKLGGLTRDQVDEVLRLEKRFEEMPVLREALVCGEVSAGKLARVAGVATVENSERVLEMVRKFSYAALDIKVREIKIENGLFEPRTGVGSLCAQTLEELGISAEVAGKLGELKRKGLDLNEVLSELLEKREVGIEAEESEIQQDMEVKAELREFYEERLIVEEGAEEGLAKRSRYVPRKVERLIYKKFGERCSRGDCGRRAEHLHHLKEYAAGGGQTPENLLPLCRGHHELEHG